MQVGNDDDMNGLVGKSLGQFRIVERISSGGMGTIFKAYQPNLDRYVAIKALPAYHARDTLFFRRFLQEMRTVARLVDPNILQIHDFGEQDKIIYIVMEYINDGTLKDRLKRAMPIPETIDYMIQAARGLDCAHRNGIIHCDVKPANMLLRKDGFLLLSDFGNAKIPVGTTNLTRVGTGIGTPQYMSPEQGTGQEVDRRSDIYSLGIVLFQCLAGRVPYTGDNPLTITIKHLNEPLPVDLLRSVGVPKPIEQVVIKMTAKAPQDRYQTTDELITALITAQWALKSAMPISGHSAMPQQDVQQAVVEEVNSNLQQLLSSTQLPPQTILKARFQILALLGKGGMGAVYKAKDATFSNRFVAVKQMIQSRLSPQMLPIFTDNFKREANLLASLMHPNLPRIYEYFSEGECWYLVMDYIEGINLQKYLEQSGGRLSIEEALRIGIDLSSVLHYLHNRQPPIIFRDLKPANVMLNAEGHLYLIDFGIARQFNPAQQKDTHNFQTPGYAAPEQFNQKQTTHQSDIYSLGATLHQLLSGTDPTDNVFDLPPLQIGIPELTTLIAQMLELKQANRPDNMLIIKQELQHILVQVQGAMKPQTPPLRPVQHGLGYLRILEGKGMNSVFELRKESNSIGRAVVNDICLDDMDVSRHHVTISKNDNSYSLKDEGSANGTRYNGRLVNSRQLIPLQEGDKLQIGLTTFIFTYQN